MRVNITLECTSCHERTYLTSKNRRNNPDRLELNKYCPREHKVVLPVSYTHLTLPTNREV